jgi:hypothetical protein
MKADMMDMKRILAPLTAVLMLVVACGESPLSSAGDNSTNWIGEAVPSTPASTLVLLTTATTISPTQIDLRAAEGLIWSNDRMVPLRAESPQDVIDRVWANSTGGDEYVQSHRQTIAWALPGLKVPAALPDNVLHVTSQLVFDDGGSLGREWSAAFGFWTVEPYSESRATGQRAVLFVGPGGDPTTCDGIRLESGDVCRDRVVAGLGEASEVVGFDGVTLRWVDGEYRYRLFFRTSTAGEVASHMAGSMVELVDLESWAGNAFRAVLSRLSEVSPPTE